VISNNIEEDAKRILKILKKKYQDITMKQFYPFFVFIDGRIEFYHNKNLILRLCNNNHRCTVYNYSKNKKTHFGTYNLVYMHLLFNYQYAIVMKNTHDKLFYHKLLSNIFNIRNQYLESHNITVIGKSPFQDFTFQCVGEPMDAIRAAHLQYVEKKVNKFKYKAKSSTPLPRQENIKYLNISGTEIYDRKNFIYKNI
jgi:hypothetical protein